MGHDTVRREFQQFVGELASAGWRRVISYDDPRLSGSAAYRYYLDNPLYSFPLDYELSLKEWMALDDSATWRWYADGQHMSLRFHRDRKRMDPEKPGGYLFVLQLMGEEEYAKMHFEFEDRDQWKEQWADVIGKLKRIRLEQERKLKESGVQIDEDYHDPKIHPDDPIAVE